MKKILLSLIFLTFSTMAMDERKKDTIAPTLTTQQPALSDAELAQQVLQDAVQSCRAASTAYLELSKDLNTPGVLHERQWILS